MKKKLLAAVMSAICVMTAVPSYSVLADGQKVVTLGADLSEDQKSAILRYFGIAGQNIQTLTITNTDERNHLGSYVPLEQIGTRTYSCALVSPTNSGGIQVKTANLSWVTSNMIATTLSTSGVVNCDVLAAAPFEVSGTGALTGILMAYESAVGATLDTAKKDVATQELITTTTIADSIGQVNATEIVNDTKMQVIEGNVISDNDIDIIINEVAAEQGISLTDQDRALLNDLLKKIAEQDYNYEDMKQTLERVETNLEELSNKTNPETEAPSAEAPETPETQETEALADDSILKNTDDSALGDSVIFDATNEGALTETEAPAQTENTAQAEPSGEFEITTSDSYGSDSQENAAPVDTNTEQPADNTNVEVNAGNDIVIDNVDSGENVDATIVPEGTEIPDVDGAAEENAAPEESAAAITADEMVFAPDSSAKADGTSDLYPAGQNELTVYFQRTDIAPGTGTLTMANVDGSVSETVTMNDPSKVSIEPMTNEELLDQAWGEGVKAVIYLSNPMVQSSEYHVSLSEDAFVTSDGSAHSQEIPGDAWVIRTSEYGFCIDKSKSAGVYAGDTVSGQIMMDGTAAIYAVIENADPSMVTFDAAEFTASSSFNATFGASGKTTFQVSFYDADGNLLNTIDYSVTIK